MKDSIMDNLRFWGLTILFGVLIIVATIVIIGSIQNAVYGEDIQIEGAVTNYKLYDDYLYLEFNNDSDGYEISLPDTYDSNGVWDFTVKSNMLIKLRKSGAWWNTDDRWSLVHVIKVPKNPGGLK